jgi:hypothetical protein
MRKEAHKIEVQRQVNLIKKTPPQKQMTAGKKMKKNSSPTLGCAQTQRARVVVTSDDDENSNSDNECDDTEDNSNKEWKTRELSTKIWNCILSCMVSASEAL